jgi:hypothetical protein
MKNLFKRNEPQPVEESPVLPLLEARQLMPTSAKSPDQQRLMVFNPDEEIDENTDEDLAFLNSLLNEEQAPPQKRQPAPKKEPSPEPEARSIAAQNADDMQVFRDMAAQRQRVELAKHLRVDDVDMGELLDDLQTMRAAIRRRKAA